MTFFKEKIASYVLVLAILSCVGIEEMNGQNSTDSNHFVLVGDLSSVYTNGTITIRDFSKKKKGTAMSGMMAATPVAKSSDTKKGTAMSGMTPAVPAPMSSDSKEGVEMSGMTPAVKDTDIKKGTEMSGMTPASKPSDAKKGASMSMMSMGGGASSDETIVAEGEILNGQFSLSGTIEHPSNVYIEIRAEDIEGKTYAPTKGMNFILEPGELHLKLGKMRQHFVITGGKNEYNTSIFGYKLKEEYKNILDEYSSIYDDGYDKLSEEQKKERTDKAVELQGILFDIELEERLNLATKSKDKETLLLLLDTGWLGGPWTDEAQKALIEMSIDDARVREMATSLIERNKAAAQREAFTIGSDIRYFYAETLNGKMVSLRDYCTNQNNKYVLLEFWASWCGPCRAEIPNMKKAYEVYNPKGFEIFSFTIDDKRKAWEKASIDEDFAWVNAGMGTKSGPKDLYGVGGVPANYLIDVTTGKIIARNLRGDKLEKKLEELLK